MGLIDEKMSLKRSLAFRMPYGAYRGRTVGEALEVDPGYLRKYVNEARLTMRAVAPAVDDYLERKLKRRAK